MDRLSALARYVFDRATHVAFRLLNKRHAVHGIETILSDTTVDVGAALAKLESALDVLRNIDGRRFRMVTHYLRHVIVWPGHYTAYDRWGGVHLASRHLLQAPVELLASALVHEATHLRIAKRGIRYTPELRARIEGICTGEQVSFLRRVPNMEKSWLNEVQSCLSTPWWDDVHRKERIERAFLEAGVPLWVASLLHTTTAPRSARS